MLLIQEQYGSIQLVPHHVILIPFHPILINVLSSVSLNREAQGSI